MTRTSIFLLCALFALSLAQRPNPPHPPKPSPSYYKPSYDLPPMPGSCDKWLMTKTIGPDGDIPMCGSEQGYTLAATAYALNILDIKYKPGDENFGTMGPDIANKFLIVKDGYSKDNSIDLNTFNLISNHERARLGYSFDNLINDLKDKPIVIKLAKKFKTSVPVSWGLVDSLTCEMKEDPETGKLSNFCSVTIYYKKSEYKTKYYVLPAVKADYENLFKLFEEIHIFSKLPYLSRGLGLPKSDPTPEPTECYRTIVLRSGDEKCVECNEHSYLDLELGKCFKGTVRWCADYYDKLPLQPALCKKCDGDLYLNISINECRR